jgi:hypothetical protein
MLSCMFQSVIIKKLLNSDLICGIIIKDRSKNLMIGDYVT